MKGSSGLVKIENAIKKDERILGEEIEKEEKAASWFFGSLTFKLLIVLIIFGAVVYGMIYFFNAQNVVSIDTSEISAPIISLAPSTPGVLEKVFVKEGQAIPADMTVAQVAGLPIKSKVDGIVIFVQNTPGQIFSSASPVVKMIDPLELRVIGHLDEDKGLSDVRIGQRVIFTVDSFGSKEYNGIVEEITPTSRDSAIAFSISSKRPEKQFDVKARFDIEAYPELRNGMSAKIIVYK